MAASIRQQQRLFNLVVQCRLAGRTGTQNAPTFQLLGTRPVRLSRLMFSQPCRSLSTTTSRQDQRPPPDPSQSATSTGPQSTPPPSPASNAPPRRRRGPRIILAAAFILLGVLGGSSVKLLLQPPVPPVPGSDADAYTTDIIRAGADKIPLVSQLSNDPEWESWPAYADLPADQTAGHLTAGALSGSRGLGAYQQVFRRRRRNTDDCPAEIIVVAYLGSAATGWPGVVHGGCLAAVLDETCGRAAAESLAGRAAVTARLALRYVRPTLAGGFYVVRARVRPDEQLDEAERGKRAYKAHVDATLEDAVSGHVCVAAEALFVAPRGGKTKGGEKSSFGLPEHF